MSVFLEALGGVVVAALLVYLAASINVVREYQRVVLFRLGRATGARAPGLSWSTR